MKTNEPCPHHSIVQLEQGDKITTQCTRCGKKMKVVKKPKCSCYGGFDCDVCNPAVKESLTPQTDTPRTDACPHCGEQGASIRNTHKGEEWFYDCGTHIDAGEYYRTLACSRISEIRDLKGMVKVAKNYKTLNDSTFKVVMNELAASKAEVERLRSQLNRAVEIAEKIWADCSNGSEHTELAALKEEIK